MLLQFFEEIGFKNIKVLIFLDFRSFLNFYALFLMIFISYFWDSEPNKIHFWGLKVAKMTENSFHVPKCHMRVIFPFILNATMLSCAKMSHENYSPKFSKNWFWWFFGFWHFCNFRFMCQNVTWEYFCYIIYLSKYFSCAKMSHETFWCFCNIFFMCQNVTWEYYIKIRES